MTPPFQALSKSDFDSSDTLVFLRSVREVPFAGEPLSGDLLRERFMLYISLGTG